MEKVRLIKRSKRQLEIMDFCKDFSALVFAGDDLASSIKNANWDGKLKSPTLHMQSACHYWEQSLSEINEKIKKGK